MIQTSLIIFLEKLVTLTICLCIIALTFLPCIGFILYLIIGQDLSKQKMFKTKEEEDNHFRGLALMQNQEINEGKFQYIDPNFQKYEDHIKMHLMNSDAYFTQNNNVDLFFTGEEKFEAMLESISKAKEYIYIEYYIFKSDRIGSKFIDALSKKAKEGIDVKLLVDGMGGRNLSKKSKKQLEDAGVGYEI